MSCRPGRRYGGRGVWAVESARGEASREHQHLVDVCDVKVVGGVRGHSVGVFGPGERQQRLP
jgi:hypothetical protein